MGGALADLGGPLTLVSWTDACTAPVLLAPAA
jgi:hypothetical protein